MNIIFLAHFKQVDFLFFTHQPQLSLWSLEAALKQNGLTFLFATLSYSANFIIDIFYVTHVSILSSVT